MYEEIVKAVSNAAAIFKLVCGVGNNAAWLVMMEGYDHARRCKAFRRSLKGGHMVGWYFKKAVNDFKDYERQLLTTGKNRMFHVADMTEDVRRKYGDISDAQYYEFWKDGYDEEEWKDVLKENELTEDDMNEDGVIAVGGFENYCEFDALDEYLKNMGVEIVEPQENSKNVTEKPKRYLVTFK